MSLIDSFKIKPSGRDISGVCIIEINNKFETAYISSSDGNTVIVEYSGTIMAVEKGCINHIYHIDSEEETLLNPNKNDYDHVLSIMELYQGKNQVEFAQKAYENIAKIRNLSSVSKSNGVAKLIKPVSLDKKQLGYLIVRSASISEMNYEKASSTLIDGMKELGLTIVNI